MFKIPRCLFVVGAIKGKRGWRWLVFRLRKEEIELGPNQAHGHVRLLYRDSLGGMINLPNRDRTSFEHHTSDFFNFVGPSRAFAYGHPHIAVSLRMGQPTFFDEPNDPLAIRLPV